MVTATTHHIDLKLPRGWNQCTTEQLEVIAATILRHSLRQDRYHPFDWMQVKTELFFLLTGVAVVSRSDDDDDAFVCRFHSSLFTLKSWQVQSFIDQHLAWLDDPKAPQLLRFPYKERIVTREWHLRRTRWNIPVPVLQRVTHGPTDGLLQDYQWHEYSHLQQLMEQYVNAQNRAVDTTPAASTVEELHAARNRFLATLFRCTDRPQLVVGISDVEWQVVLFWWSGFMNYLMQHYPRCFKQAGGKSAKRSRQKHANPLDLYTSVIATMQTQAHLSENDINGQTFHVVLEQLERLSKQNEEMEKLSKGHK